MLNSNLIWRLGSKRIGLRLPEKALNSLWEKSGGFFYFRLWKSFKTLK